MLTKPLVYVINCTLPVNSAICIVIVPNNRKHGNYNCEDDGPNLQDIQSVTVEDLHAPQEGGQGQPISGQFTKFDFETGSETNSETDWDIAFRGTSIIVNGGISLGTNDEPERTGDAGVYIFNGTMAEMVVVDTSLITQDSSEGYAIASGSGNGWYTYTGPPTYLISPTPGKILVFRTRDGKYAKMEILSYYLGAPENPDAFSDPSRYYTFNYVYQPNEGVTDFE